MASRGIVIGIYLLWRLMRKLGLRSVWKREFVHTTDSKPADLAQCIEPGVQPDAAHPDLAAARAALFAWQTRDCDRVQAYVVKGKSYNGTRTQPSTNKEKDYFPARSSMSKFSQVVFNILNFLPSILKVNMKTYSFAAALVLGLTGTAALAQATHSGWYLAPTASWVKNDTDRAKDTGAGLGLAVGKMLNEKWNVEVGGQYLRLDGKNDEQGNIGVDGLYFFNRNPDFAPYAVAGLAWAREGYSDSNRNDNLMARAGLGFTKQLTKNVDFRTDARYQWHSNKAGANDLGDWIVSAGLNIAFGGTPQAPAPAYVAPVYVAPAPVYVAPAPAYVAPAPAPAPEPYVAPKREAKQERN